MAMFTFLLTLPRKDSILAPPKRESNGQPTFITTRADKGGFMSDLNDAIQVLGIERVAEIRADVTELLNHVLANRSRYAKRGSSAIAGGQLSPSVAA
jgi:hypothetical protein